MMMGSIRTIFREWQRRERVSQIDTSYDDENESMYMDEKVSSESSCTIEVVHG